THRPSGRVCRGDLPCRHRIGAAWPDPRFAGARHVALADPAAHRAAAGSRAHAASVRLAAVDHDQGHRDRLSDRATSAHAAIGNTRGSELSTNRGLQLRDARLFPDPLSGDARRGSHLSTRRAFRTFMNFDWSVVGAHRDALAAATGTTVLLTVATMA